MKWSDILPAWPEDQDLPPLIGPPPVEEPGTPLDGLGVSPGWAGPQSVPTGKAAWVVQPVEPLPPAPAAVSLRVAVPTPAPAQRKGARRRFPAGSPWATPPPGHDEPPDVPPADPPPSLTADPSLPQAADPSPSPAIDPFPSLAAGLSPSPAAGLSPSVPDVFDAAPDQGRPDLPEVVAVVSKPMPRPGWAGPSAGVTAVGAGFDDEQEGWPVDSSARSLEWKFENGAEESGVTAAGAFGGGPEGPRGLMRAFDPGRRGVRALAAVAGVVILLAAFLAWHSRPRVDPVTPAPFATDAAAAPANTGAGSSGGVPSAAPSPTDLVIAVEGKVIKPGVVRLPPGSRVIDALAAAGGADPGVDVSLLNPARKVVDGELILVGVTPPPGTTVGGGGPASTGGAATAPAGPINLNIATLSDLETLPGVGPVLAQHILTARDAQGGFKSVDDLRKVSGIGDTRFAQLKDLVTV